MEDQEFERLSIVTGLRLTQTSLRRSTTFTERTPCSTIRNRASASAGGATFSRPAPPSEPKTLHSAADHRRGQPMDYRIYPDLRRPAILHREHHGVHRRQGGPRDPIFSDPFAPALHARSGSNKCPETHKPMIKQRTATLTQTSSMRTCSKQIRRDAGIRSEESASREPDEARRHLSVKRHLCDAWRPVTDGRTYFVC